MPFRGPAQFMNGQAVDLTHQQALAGLFSGILALTYMRGVEAPYLRNGVEAAA